MKRALFHPEAARELRHSIEFYEGRVPGLGQEYASEVEASVQLICQHPVAWPKRTRNTRACIMKRFPFAIIYLDQPDRIWVIAVAHSSRRPGYWAGRVQSGAEER